MSFMFSPPPNTLHSHMIAVTVRYLDNDGRIIVNSIPQFPAITHSHCKIGEVENNLIQSKWDWLLKWEQMAFLTAILLNTQHWRIKHISGDDMKLFRWVAETMNSS